MKLHLRVALLLLLATLFWTTACTTSGQYFGETDPPDTQRLTYLNATEPETLDPAKATGVPEGHIIEAMFEGLTKYHPKTLAPMAALATHYETNGDSSQFTFYLRGHAAPKGVKLPNTDTLRQEYEAGQLKEDLSRGHAAPADHIPAKWSDGKVITAHDFVYSWRRVVDPATAADYASLLYYVKHAEEINAGKVRLRDRATSKFRIDPATGKELAVTEKELESDPKLAALAKNSEVVKFTPEDLAVRALDDFTFQVDMRAPTAFFVKMQSHTIFAAVPQHEITAAENSGQESNWTQPGQMVTSGPFMLKKWRPYDRIIMAKNPHYYEAELVALNEITMLPINDNTTNVNLYKSGVAGAMSANAIPQPFISILRRDKADFHITPSLGSYYYLVNTKKPPFNNINLRYALNMAMDKKAITDFLGAGQTPASNLVPPIEGYEIPKSLPVTIDGKTYDVLSYNPEAARELMAKAGYPNGVGPDGKKLTVEILFNTLESHKQIAEIVQQQWRKNLNINAVLVNQEWKVYLETLDNLHYNGVARRGWIGDYIDPNSFLDMFVTGSVNNGSGWTDPHYDRMLSEANATTDPAERIRKLAECEQYLLRNMPFVPIYIYSWFFLEKPYVRGNLDNILDKRRFEYVWIDPDWEKNVERPAVARR